MSQDPSTVSTTGKESLSRVDPEVKVKPERRRFTAEYKLRILKEADNCTGPGQIGALLRREGLYSSNLTQWRLQRAEGVLQALTPRKRGPKVDPLAEENAALRQRVDRLEAELKRAETIIEVQKKVSELLGLSGPSNRKSDEIK
jgi:transposase-like protein